jgi:hypothetical protein
MYYAYPDWLKDVTLTNWEKADWYANDIDRKQA